MAKSKSNQTLIIRFSSLGDVAMTIPVVYSVAKRYPDEEFVLITKKPFQAIFINKPNNLVLADQNDASILSINKVADLHSVLRSWRMDLSFFLKGAKVTIINKGRKEKKKLTREKHKQFKQLDTSTERYQQVFERLGYDATLDFNSLFTSKNKHPEAWIGIAPFAKHPGKTYPLEQMEEVIRLLSLRPQVQLFLFGGSNDREKLEEWAEKYKNVQSVAGQMSFPEELHLINDLDVMLSMDSANMHLASLVNTPVVSIWGATHPYAGFYGYHQNPENVVQVDLACRPCSVFGNKPCWRGDYACLNEIRPEMIVEKILFETNT
ncbi:glycosyl transferase family 1 [Bacteroidia bacterium]|nr:glycosyl transferase family 1 [Bacteroidia bacterium]